MSSLNGDEYEGKVYVIKAVSCKEDSSKPPAFS
jgi:hypothetical protein